MDRKGEKAKLTGDGDLDIGIHRILVYRLERDGGDPPHDTDSPARLLV
jgi:hypothetical protein